METFYNKSKFFMRFLLSSFNSLKIMLKKKEGNSEAQKLLQKVDVVGRMII